ncbi:MAG TPA: hypothetical protein VNZ68_12150 [Rhodocyclaceae bacterium]|nr:hypothetical protein [Rhodocyclaceae bacterium]
MTTEDHAAALYQSIGELVVSFQWVENLYRQIGWLILDPTRKTWPPTALRDETNHVLIDKVTAMLLELIECHKFPNGAEVVQEAQELQLHFQEFRKYRNRLLHSTCIELNAGGELLGHMQANPRLIIKPDTGEQIVNVESLTSEHVRGAMAEYARHACRLSALHLQLIHWAPFTQP